MSGCEKKGSDPLEPSNNAAFPKAVRGSDPFFSQPSGPLARRTGEISIRVRYAETDRMGLLHHSRYLVYFEQGRVELTSAQSGLKTTVDLAKQSASADGLVVYRGMLPKLVDSVQYELYVGDAWTDPAHEVA